MNGLMESSYISILSDRCEQLRKEKEELQKRIDEAIKHVEEKTYNGMFELYDSSEDEGISDLLRILRGEKLKEEK